MTMLLASFMHSNSLLLEGDQISMWNKSFWKHHFSFLVQAGAKLLKLGKKTLKIIAKSHFQKFPYFHLCHIKGTGVSPGEIEIWFIVTHSVYLCLRCAVLGQFYSFLVPILCWFTSKLKELHLALLNSFGQSKKYVSLFLLAWSCLAVWLWVSCVCAVLVFKKHCLLCADGEATSEGEHTDSLRWDILESSCIHT